MRRPKRRFVRDSADEWIGSTTTLVYACPGTSKRGYGLSRTISDAAEAWVEGLFAKVENVAAMPRMGRVVPELRREVIREVFYKQYRVIYKIQPERVEILTVRHMRQQLDEGEVEE